MHEQKKRKFIFTPILTELSYEDYFKIKNFFLSNYPVSTGIEESIMCLFFSLLIDGILPNSAQINTFYSIRKDHISYSNGSIRIHRRDGQSGVEIFLSSHSKIFLYSHILKLKELHAEEKNSKVWSELIPSFILSKTIFKKKFRGWLRELSRRAGASQFSSITEVASIRDLPLLEIYPPFILAAVTQKIRFSNLAESSKNKEMTPIAQVNSQTTVESEEDSDPVQEMLFQKHRSFFEISNRLNQSTTLSDRRSMAGEVLKKLADYTSPININSPDEQNFLILGNWLPALLYEKRSSANTIRTYFQQLSYLLRTELLGQSINNFSQTDVEDVLENCSYGKTSVLKAALSSFLNFAVQHCGIQISPINWKAISTQQNLKDVSIFWPKDMEKVLASADHEKRAAIILGFFCGMRIGEIASLRLADISIEGESYLNIRSSKTKSGRRRLPLNLLLPSRTHSEFSRYYFSRLEKVASDRNRYLIENYEGEAFSNPQVLALSVQKLFKLLGFEWATFHSLRHSFASLLLLRWHRAYNGFNTRNDYQLEGFDFQKDKLLLSHGLPDIARLAGHADVKTTVKNYIHTIALLQKEFLYSYEAKYPLIISTTQGRNLLNLSKSGFYKQFPVKNKPVFFANSNKDFLSSELSGEQILLYLEKKLKAK